MSPGTRSACTRAVLALVVLLVFGIATAAASPRDVLVDYVPDGIIDGDYTVAELTGSLRLVRGQDGDYESFADAVQMKIAERLAGGHRSSERPEPAPQPAPAPPPAPPVVPAQPTPPPAPGDQHSQEVAPPPPAVSPVKPDDEVPGLPAAPAPRQNEIAIPSPPPAEPGEGPPWAFVALAVCGGLFVLVGLGAAGWRRLQR